MTQARIQHNQLSMMLNFMLAKEKRDVIELGRELQPMFDNLFEGGFWIWDIKKNIEYYSPLFRKVLGFKGESDFPNVPASWQKYIHPDGLEEATKAFEAHKRDESNPYHMKVTYNRKTGDRISLICSGTLVDRENMIMLGTHELI